MDSVGKVLDGLGMDSLDSLGSMIDGMVGGDTMASLANMASGEVANVAKDILGDASEALASACGGCCGGCCGAAASAASSAAVCASEA